MARIHILGASGSGTTTLGVAVSERLHVLHADTDSFFWVPTDPPFTTRRPPEERLMLLLSQLKPAEDWVLSGSAISWATPLEPFYELIVFLLLDPTIRMARLQRREIERYGERVLPGGDMEAANNEFLEWAASYDRAGPERRSLVAHEDWLARQTAPVLRLDSNAPIESLVATVIGKLELPA